jgi:probable rRNA maturation factor
MSLPFSGRPRVFVRNVQRVLRVELADLQKDAEHILESVLRVRAPGRTQLDRLNEISVWLISDRRMAQLHRRFLGKRGPTDVLTFEHGEIFISVQTARRHARRFRTSLNEELKLYVTHGMLHLRGFDDRQKKDARRMERLQQRILRGAGGLN